jgi:large subunit ribosomal protein L10
MNRQQKEQIVVDLRQMITEAQATFLVNYKGLTVASLQQLRRTLHTGGNKLRVAKATLMQKAAQDIAGAPSFSESFKDQVGLVFAKSDVSGAAKQLMDFAKDNQLLQVIAGFYETRVLGPEELKFLASLPSRDVLIAQMLGTLQAPMTSTVRILYMLIARLVIVLKEIEKKQAGNQ